MTIVVFFRFVESEFGVPHAHENKLWKHISISQIINHNMLKKINHNN